jgi:Fe2+ transport system protein FeoA
MKTLLLTTTLFFGLLVPGTAAFAGNPAIGVTDLKNDILLVANKSDRSSLKAQIKSVRANLASNRKLRVGLITAVLKNDNEGTKRFLMELGLSEDFLKDSKIEVVGNSGDGGPVEIRIPTPWGPIDIDIDIRIRA